MYKRPACGRAKQYTAGGVRADVNVELCLSTAQLNAITQADGREHGEFLMNCVVNRLPQLTGDGSDEHVSIDTQSIVSMISFAGPILNDE